MLWHAKHGCFSLSISHHFKPSEAWLQVLSLQFRYWILLLKPPPRATYSITSLDVLMLATSHIALCCDLAFLLVCTNPSDSILPAVCRVTLAWTAPFTRLHDTNANAEYFTAWCSVLPCFFPLWSVSSQGFLLSICGVPICLLSRDLFFLFWYCLFFGFQIPQGWRGIYIQLVVCLYTPWAFRWCCNHSLFGGISMQRDLGNI